MFKVHVKKEGKKPPQDDFYHIIAKNGFFMHKKTKLIEAIIPIKELPGLEWQERKARILLPKIPVELMAITLNFFEAVFDRFHSEAVVLLYYNDEENTYMLNAPKQEVMAGSVEYDSSERFDGFQLVGTIHNHSNFNAFHSGTDDADERHFDGLHLTTGNILDLHPTISASVVVNGSRFNLKPGQIIEDIVMIEEKKLVTQHPPSTLPLTRKERKRLNKLNNRLNSKNNWWEDRKKDKTFRLSLPEGKTMADYPFDPTWIDDDNVEKQKIVVKRWNYKTKKMEDINDPLDDYKDPYEGYTYYGC